MKHPLYVIALFLLWVVLTACSSEAAYHESSPTENPSPPGTEPETEYPDVEKLWVTSSATGRVCGNSGSFQLHLDLTQVSDVLSGTFVIKGFDGDYIYTFNGAITENGEIAGTATRSNSADYVFDLTATKISLAGTITSQYVVTCADNSQDQTVIDATLY